jgi:exonuclease III
MVRWLSKQDPTICCLQKTHFICEDIHRLKIKEWKGFFHAYGNQRRIGVAIVIENNIEFKQKL